MNMQRGREAAARPRAPQREAQTIQNVGRAAAAGRRRLHRDAAGAGVLEYSLVAALVSAALLGAIFGFGLGAVESAGTIVNSVLP